MNYDEMMAGRELDILIDARIFGQPPSALLTPSYSTLIQSAWLIVKHFNGLGADVEIHAYADGDCGCFISKERPQSAGQIEWGSNAQAPTVPLAICRSALKAQETMP